MDMLDERSAFDERRDETHDASGFDILSGPPESAQIPLYVVVYRTKTAAEVPRN